MAVSVELTDFERVAGFVNPGNEVAVFATVLDPIRILPDDEEPTARRLHADRPDPQPRARRRTRPASPRGPPRTTRAPATEEVAKTILTIAVTQEQAEKLVQADRTGDLNFALLTDDTVSDDNPGARPATLFPELFRGVAP